MNVAHSVGRALLTVGEIALIIFPLTVGYQVLRDNRWLRRRAGPWRLAVRRLGLGEASVVPLVAGLVLGIVYGAGVLIEEARAGSMSRREVFLLALFLCTCHAVIEDTLLFVVMGADPLWVLGPRVALAVGATAGLAKLLPAGAPTPDP